MEQVPLFKDPQLESSHVVSEPDVFHRLCRTHMKKSSTETKRPLSVQSLGFPSKSEHERRAETQRFPVKCSQGWWFDSWGQRAAVQGGARTGSGFSQPSSHPDWKQTRGLCVEVEASYQVTSEEDQCHGSEEAGGDGGGEARCVNQC